MVKEKNTLGLTNTKTGILRECPYCHQNRDTSNNDYGDSQHDFYCVKTQKVINQSGSRNSSKNSVSQQQNINNMNSVDNLPQPPSKWRFVVLGLLVAGVVGLIAGISYWIHKKRKAKKAEAEEELEL